ncbi:hypothetical protein [Vibrio parahaemolyticus]|uniref:hypothetical protein n=1 Tax=Vibrio parahaemolyticus TaxID=670 RepID=UPI00084A460B|nr:hypothetical protein [Vibrio parahaemolyticus]ODY11637.1 hypothetical protein BBM17_18700 [Vibrio parahaemolyticus]
MKEKNIFLSHADFMHLRYLNSLDSAIIRPPSAINFSNALDKTILSIVEVKIDKKDILNNEQGWTYSSREDTSAFQIPLEKWLSLKNEAENVRGDIYSRIVSPNLNSDVRNYLTNVIDQFLNLSVRVEQASFSLYIQKTTAKEKQEIFKDFSIMEKALNDATEKLNDAENNASQMIEILQVTKNELLELESLSKSQILKNSQTIVEEAQQSIEYRLAEANENLRSSIQSLRNELDTKTEQAERKISELVAKTARQQNVITSEIKELFSLLEEESTNRVEVRIQRAEAIATELAHKANETKQAVEEALSENRDSLHDFIVENQNKLNDVIRKASTDSSLEIQQAQTNAQQSFNKHVNENISSIEKRITEKVSTYDELKNRMENSFKEKVETLEAQISILTSGVMADQHIKQANTERNVYWALQIFGFLFMIAAIYSGSVFFSEITNIRLPLLPKPDLVVHVDGAIGTGQNPTTLMFLRLSMIILLTAPAIYLLKEAAVHRHKENLYRQRGIQLATISPYLEELEKEERAAIKKELVSSFFQFHDGKADTQNVPDFIRDMREMVGIAKSINGQKKTMRERLRGK